MSFPATLRLKFAGVMDAKKPGAASPGRFQVTVLPIPLQCAIFVWELQLLLIYLIYNYL